MRRSLGSILMSTSSASGSTATVAVWRRLWMRPLASVLGDPLHAVHAALST